MSIRKLVLCGLIVVAFVKSTEGQQKCRTPSGSIGHCIGFEKCSFFSKMTQKGWFTPQDTHLIEKSWCGTFNGVRTICCPIARSIEITKLQPVTSPVTTPTTFVDLSTHPNTKLMPLENCGKGSLNKIVVGSKTEPFEFPWMAMLRTLSNNNQLSMICGGTLISSRYVLTAAHCLRAVQGEIKIHSVVLGEHDTRNDPDCIDDDDCADGIQEILVERQIPHPNFISANAKNDIGLVRLRRKASFSFSVMPICIPYTQESLTNDLKKVIVSGWGGTEHGPSSQVLLKAELNVIANSECSPIYRRHYFDRVQIDENYMCALDEKSDTCAGDSGGPATFIAPNSRVGPRVFQYGIVSAGARTCGRSSGIPGLYTRVTSYVQWILDNISE